MRCCNGMLGCRLLPDCGSTTYRGVYFIAFFHLGEFVRGERHQPRQKNFPSEPALPNLSLAEVPVGHSSCRSPQLRAGIRIACDENSGYCFAEVSNSHYLAVGSSGFYLQFSQETSGILKTHSPFFQSDLGFCAPLTGS